MVPTKFPFHILQRRDRDCLPPLHVLEHVLHPDHLVHVGIIVVVVVLVSVVVVHGSSLHRRFCSPCPGQSFARHCRFRFCQPLPHDREQVDHCDHGDHSGIT